MARPLLPISNPNAEHFVLHYNPHRNSFNNNSASLAEKNFSLFIWILFGSLGVLGLIACGCFSLNPIPLLVLVALLGGIFLAIDVSRPTNLELTPDGFRILWLHPLFFFAGPWLEWKCINQADIQDDDTGGAIERYFQISIDTKGLTSTNGFELMCTSITSSFDANQMTIRFSESGFFQAADRANFSTMLRRHVNQERQSAELLAWETFGDVPSYTALWLHDLQKRQSNEPKCLPDHTTLANGKYEVLKRLGSGGQSVVYEAVKKDAQADSPTDTERPCVLKEFVLPSHGGHEVKRRALQNIQREHALLNSFDHPNIVKSLDLFTEGTRAYLVMERINGRNLRQLVEQGELPQTMVIPLAVQMCDLLSYLHQCHPPVVHRDFTPENLLLTDDHQVKLIDFNVAHRLESASTKTVAGKHAYISPEQFRGKPTAASDIYSLGASLYFILMKKDPEPISKSVPDCDARLAKIVAHCTEPAENDRYATVAQVKTDLQALPAATTAGM